MNKIQIECRKLLKQEDININSNINFDVNGKIYTLSLEYIIDTFMKASEDSQQIFLIALEKALKTKDLGINKFFEDMGQLLLMTHLSDKIEV